LHDEYYFTFHVLQERELERDVLRVQRREAIDACKVRATRGLTLGDVGSALGSDEGVGIGRVANHEHLHGL